MTTVSADVTYLEFSDPSINSHKFYEVSVTGEILTIRYGRMGTAGRSQATPFDTPEQARAAADRKIREQQRKGYQIVIPIITPTGISTETPTVSLTATPPTESIVTPIALPEDLPKAESIVQAASHEFTQSDRASVNSVSINFAPINSTSIEICPAPIRWRFNSGATNFGIAVDADHCWLGNEHGQVLKLDHEGTLLQQVKLPNAVKCIVTDDIWVYVGCDNGNVYDLTGKIPYLAYEIERDLDIFWLAIHDGMLGISDGNGGLTKTDPDGDILWTRLSGGKLGWMLCCDGEAFYHGHSKGITAYGFAEGRQLWHQPTLGKVLFGCQRGDRLYGATSGKQVQCFSTTGDLLGHYSCTASVYSCTTDAENRYVFAADSSAMIYGFEQTGQLIWQVRTGCGSALSMHHWEDCLYIATNQGVLACIDVSPLALRAAQGGQLPQTTTIPPSPQSLAQSLTPVATSLETHTQAENVPAEGVILECFRQGQQLRVRVISEGYQSDWMVQFPRNLRQEGDRYWVQSVKPAKQGGFYRPYGEIKRLD